MTEEEHRLACHVCRKEIPEAAAVHAEAEGYILHFCATGCLASWQNELRKTPAGPQAGEAKKEENR